MKDGIIETFVNMAESEKPVDCPVTLMVKGSLVSGKIISREEYMTQNHITKELQDLYLERAASTGDNLKGSSEFVHLRDAKYYIGGIRPIPYNSSVFIRIKTEDVSAFNFGDLEYTE